jgi:hypothetical protein
MSEEFDDEEIDDIDFYDDNDDEDDNYCSCGEELDVDGLCPVCDFEDDFDEEFDEEDDIDGF